jgi:hypothetical protein
MAGFVTKLQGYVYSGDYEAAQEMTNGMFAELSNELVIPSAAKRDTVLRVNEKTELWGMPALRLDVVSVGKDEVFFVEQDFPPNHEVEWNDALNKVKPDEKVRMKRLLPGEQVIMTVDDTLFSGVNIGAIMQPAANGTVSI